MENNDFRSKSYYAMALDPIHVGTGGYRLGRVDNTIVREPGTNLPKIPGTSLSGITRTYLAMQEDGKFPRCAGQGQEEKGKPDTGHCGKEDCKVCSAFGFSKKQNSFAGLANFSDMHILLFPVATMQGPVWITCPGQLGLIKENTKFPKISDKNRAILSTNLKSPVNLGWLLLEGDKAKEDDFHVSVCIPNEIKQRTVVVSNKLFGQIINNNLEVRTSVSIDPATGAAQSGALFTYEAIPRSTIFYFDVVFNNPQHFKIVNKAITAFNGNGANQMDALKKSIEKGFEYIKSLGIGGMNSRGMGRMEILNIKGDQNESNPTD